MKTVYSNNRFRVDADAEENNYKIVNTSTGILEDIVQTEYEAVRIAVVSDNAINELITRNDGWPAVTKEKH